MLPVLQVHNDITRHDIQDFLQHYGICSHLIPDESAEAQHLFQPYPVPKAHENNDLLQFPYVHAFRRLQLHDQYIPHHVDDTNLQSVHRSSLHISELQYQQTACDTIHFYFRLNFYQVLSKAPLNFLQTQIPTALLVSHAMSDSTASSY